MPQNQGTYHTKEMKSLFYSLAFLAFLSSCNVRKVKDTTKVDSVAIIQRNEVTEVNSNTAMVLIDTSRIITESRTVEEFLNDSGKVVKRIFSYEIKSERKAISETTQIKEVKKSEVKVKDKVKVSKVDKAKDKSSMFSIGFVLVVLACAWIWFTYKK